ARARAQRRPLHLGAGEPDRLGVAEPEAVGQAGQRRLPRRAAAEAEAEDRGGPQPRHRRRERAPARWTRSEGVEAGRPGRSAMAFTAVNVGKRPMLVVLRPRMIGLNVDGPDGLKRCEAGASTGAVARDAFRTLTPGQSIKMTLLLGEICPVDVFSRP